LEEVKKDQINSYNKLFTLLFQTAWLPGGGLLFLLWKSLTWMCLLLEGPG
jgi:hypothetical protein